ncbi:DNA polymerase [Rhodopseudomonas palustris]
MRKPSRHTVLCKPHIILRRAQVVAARATIDFETRSELDVTRVGPWKYSRHHSTEPLCLAFHTPGTDPMAPDLWHRAHPDIGVEESRPPEALFDWIERGGMVEAHNVDFEADIWANVMVPKYGWPAIDPEQWLCSAAKCAAVALPRSLDDAIKALGLPIEKNPEGKALLRRFSKPVKLTDRQREVFGDWVQWNEDTEGLGKLWEYCRQDVRAEYHLSRAVPDLPPAELELWRIACAMNRRGVMLDVPLIRAALDLAAKAKRKLNAELHHLTGINSGTQRAALRTWLAENENLELADTKSATIDWHLERNRDALSDRAIRVVQIIKDVNRTSTGKYKRMLEVVDLADDRVRDTLAYCGAERTGRFAGKGIQVQNLPKGKFAKWLPKATAIDIAAEDIKSRDLDWCEAIHGNVMNLLASTLRGVIIAPPGRELMTADYSAIEARVILWLAGAVAALNVFREGKDIYCDMASGIYGREITKETAKPINAMGATERDFGKVAILGLGFGMAWLKFLLSMRSYNIVLSRADVLAAMAPADFEKAEAFVRRKLWPKPEDFTDARRFGIAKREAALSRRALTVALERPEDVVHELALCKYTVDTYRNRYDSVPVFWGDMESAAIAAVNDPGSVTLVGDHIRFKVEGRFLKMRLPSGRCLHYADPEIKFKKTSWGKTVPELRFWGRDQKNRRWVQQATYGGKLAENATQATARDLLAHAKRQIAKDPTFDLLLSVHDEIISEMDQGAAPLAAFEHVMCDLPKQFDGCPVAAEGKVVTRYRK